MSNLIPQQGEEDIVQTTQIYLMGDAGAGIATGELRYSAQDAFAVRLIMTLDATATWLLSRETLLDCMFDRPAAVEAELSDFVIERNPPGDPVQIVKVLEGFKRGALYKMHFTNADQHTHGYVPVEVMNHFLQRTLDCVPEGEEAVDVDGLLAEIFT